MKQHSVLTKYKLSIVNCQLSIILLMVALFASPLKAQVEIGNQTAPQKFSLLELTTEKIKAGLRLPQLTTDQRNALVANPNDVAKGLTIYNTDTNCVDFWNGSEWISLCDNTTTTATTLAQPGAIAGVTDVCPSGMTQTYSVAAVTGATNYTWTLPDGWTGTSTTNSITVTPALSSGITNTADGTGASVSGTIQVTANNASGSSSASTLAVTTYNGCCAYISATEWNVFGCYNLGATQNGKPFEPSADLNGDYYQWGAKTPVATRDAIIDTWSSTAPATYYGDNTTNTNITTKSLTDPCPPGYRVPSYDEWDGVISNNTKTDLGTWSADQSVSTWSGSMFGSALFLPAAGDLYQRDGSLFYRGDFGNYWSNRVVDNTFAYHMSFFYSNSGGAYVDNDYDGYRALGYPVRCIQDRNQ